MSMIAIGARSQQGVPVNIPYTEAMAAGSADSVVWEFTGGASANETGVGVLTGADLVLTQAGGVGASSGGSRPIANQNQYFTCTAAALVAMLNGAEWLYAKKIKNCGRSLAKELMALGGGGGYLHAYANDANGRFGGAIIAPSGAAVGFIEPPGQVSATDVTWLCWWRKNTNFHFGFVAQENMPMRWEDFPSGQRLVCVGAGNNSGATWATQQFAVGLSGGFSNIMDISTLVMSQRGLGAPLF
ncbi:MAG: hypothetical protein AB9900_12725 [Humidesulfovibrio sp.]